MSRYFSLLFFFCLSHQLFLKAYQRGILLVSVLIVFIVSSDWRCADEASRAGVIAVKREAAGGADRRQPWWLLSDLCWARGEGGGVKTNQLQLCWIYRDVVKEGWSLKEAVWGNEGHGLCKPLRKNTTECSDLVFVNCWAQSSMSWLQTTVGTNKKRRELLLCYVVICTTITSEGRVCHWLHMFFFFCFCFCRSYDISFWKLNGKSNCCL